MDLVFYTLQIGLFHMDFDLVSKSIDKANKVENALSSAEKLVRASPDELCHNSGDIVRALVYVHCSDVAMEGEEDSAEEKRQKALAALLCMAMHPEASAIAPALLDMIRSRAVSQHPEAYVRRAREGSVLREVHQTQAGALLEGWIGREGQSNGPDASPWGPTAAGRINPRADASGAGI
ncbi:hypothetical protein E2562_022240 [Oryza meyeriana var. granulata]|uniref:Telomere length regulation protein conserved domain-containing protein n=1 Tax=Oryza meyeriana var. granulata TaxID=110450 RepID=A0A6G1ENX0_9ORYZ|nr:hypothetical protein E2562_022240 [Oryza meyeriana var. granulata]